MKMSEKETKMSYSLKDVNRKRQKIGRFPMTEKQYDKICRRFNETDTHKIDILTVLVLSLTEKG